MLGIAEDPEAREIRAHLHRDCQNCVRGMRSARELISVIGATEPAGQPSAPLRERVFSMAGGQPASGWNCSPASAATAGALIAVIALTDWTVAEWSRTAVELRRTQSKAVAQTRELARVKEAFAILYLPDTKEVVFGGSAPLPPRGRVFLDASRGVLLLASNLPPVPAGKTYEMWIIPKAKGGKPVAAGSFQPAADGTAMHALLGPVKIEATGVVAVTVEPAIGVPQPTSRPIIAAVP